MHPREVENRLARLQAAQRKSLDLIQSWRKWQDFDLCFNHALRSTPFPFHCDGIESLDAWFAGQMTSIRRDIDAGRYQRAEYKLPSLEVVTTTINSFCPRLEAILKRRYGAQKRAESSSDGAAQNPEICRRQIRLNEISRSIEHLTRRQAVTQNSWTLSKIEEQLTREKSRFLDEKQSFDVAVRHRRR